MNKKVFIVLLVFATLALSLSGCVLSASKAPAATATSNIPFPTPLPNDAIKNAASGTQTAIAMAPVQPGNATATPQGQVVEPAPTNTLEPVVLPTQPPVVVVVPTATPGLPSTYTIQKGEWPYCIARRFNIDIAALLNTNGLNANSKPAIGTTLTIPQNAGPWNSGSRALKTHPTNYTVVSGDTVNSIACDFGDVDPNAIIAANNLASPYTLTAGQTIAIP